MIQTIASSGISHITTISSIFYAFQTEYVQKIMHKLFMKIAFSYFTFDSMYIIIKKQYHYVGYLVHHIFAIYICTCGIYGVINDKLLARYFITLEFSNTFLNYKNINLIAFTYIPARVIVLPFVTMDLIVDSYLQYRYDLCCIYVSLLVISYFYSYKIYKKFYRLNFK